MLQSRWDQLPETGIAFIDHEHRGLLAAIGRLHEALTANAPNARLCCKDLVRATETHFWHEEQSFIGSPFPRIELHLRRHTQLRTILSSFQRSLETAQQPAPLDHQLAFLRDWLLDHIVNEDMLLAEYLKAQQAETAGAE